MRRGLPEIGRQPSGSIAGRFAIDEQALGAKNPETLNDVKNLADFLTEIGRQGEARALEQRYASSGTPR